MRRCLIVANQTLTGPQLLAELFTRQSFDDYAFHVVVPATHHGGAVWTEGQARAMARAALTNALDAFQHAGVAVTGEVGDENPVLAVGDAFVREPFDEIIVSTLPAGVSRWLKNDLPRRLERRFHVPVTHVIAAPAAV